MTALLCPSGKVGHPTAVAAQRAMHQLQRQLRERRNARRRGARQGYRRAQDLGFLDVYACNHCGRFHVGHRRSRR